jgi:hypothetical protein
MLSKTNTIRVEPDDLPMLIEFTRGGMSACRTYVLRATRAGKLLLNKPEFPVPVAPDASDDSSDK